MKIFRRQYFISKTCVYLFLIFSLLSKNLKLFSLAVGFNAILECPVQPFAAKFSAGENGDFNMNHIPEVSFL